MHGNRASTNRRNGYVLDYGAVLGVPDLGKYLLVDQRPGASTVTVLDPSSERTIPKAGTLAALSWNTETADATTVMKILINEIVEETVTLSGAATGTAVLSSAVNLGDQIAIEFDAGTAPGKSNWMIYVE